MSIQLIFYTQVASIIGFIVVLFVLYRILVSQKDATIQLLKEKVEFTENKLAHAENQKPDALAKSLSERVDRLNNEIERLSGDKESNQILIDEKESELEKTKEEADELSRQISNAHELISEYFCPHCKAPMEQRSYHSESIEYGGRDIDIDHEFISFECGLTLHDGKQSSACKNT
tara:strand:- start:241 stop:765 length:525 start_codon:yes stop_codon:yes gene_type:complete